MSGEKKKNKKFYKDDYGSKEAGKGFTQIIKKNTVRRYQSLLKKENRDTAALPAYQKKKKGDTFARRRIEAEQRKAERQEASAKKQAEREAEEARRLSAIKASKEERKKRGKLYRARNYRGQPIISRQMPKMLDKIKKQIEQERQAEMKKKSGSAPLDTS